jgi:UDPglucose 6-dehydrogenase
MLCGTKEAALMGADALVIMTEWKNFRVPDFDRLKTSLKTPVIFDGRNLFEPARMRERGFDYFGIGR